MREQRAAVVGLKGDHETLMPQVVLPGLLTASNEEQFGLASPAACTKVAFCLSVLELEPAAPRLTVIVTGGTLRPLQHSLIDPLAGLVLEQIAAGTLFLGCNGVHVSTGITNINLPEAAIKRRMLASSSRRIVVADGSKVGATEVARLCGIDEVDLLITGPSADPALVDELRARHLDVMIAA